MIIRIVTAALALVSASLAPAQADKPDAGLVCDGTVQDAARAQRQIPLRVRLPAGEGPFPVILFSHGLGGSLDAGTRWAEAWTAAGFAVVHLQHPGSDASLWKGLKGKEAMAALRKGMDAKQFIARVADVKFVLDAVGGSGMVGNCPMARLDAGRIGMAGHSFGAQTVQAVAGQQFRAATGLFSVTDLRIKAAIAFSPAPAIAEPDDSAFGKITIPFLSVTGSKDTVPGLTKVTPKDRTRPFHAMPPGRKYLLVVNGADHLIFSGGEQRRAPTPTDRRTELIVAETTAQFWRANLVAPTAKGSLAAPEALGPEDVWLAR